MKTYRVPVFCNPARLYDELASAGMKVATIRADWAKTGDPVALWAVVVFQGGYTPDLAQVKTLVDAHLQSPEVNGKLPSATPGTQPDKEQSLRALERV